MSGEGNYIGVYDSGIGGLNVLAACRARLPNENFCYLGDNFNAPYGQKSRKELLSLAERAVQALLSVGVKAVVIACNTLTTECIGELRRRYPVPFIGTEPALRLAKNCRRVVVLATAATLRAARFHSLLEERKGETVCYTPPDLVQEIEKCAPDFEKIGISDHLPKTDCDGVVLGCTHYIYLKEQIARFYGAPCFDGNQGVAKRLENLLVTRQILPNDTPKKGELIFLGNAKVVNQSLFEQMFA